MRLPDDWLCCPQCGERLEDPTAFFCEQCLEEVEEEDE